MSEYVLTEKQEALLNYIEEYQLRNGGSPTIREMRDYFGVSSDNSILKHLKALEEKGKIVRDEGHRGIKLLSKIKEKLEQVEFKLPLMGMVPAGSPIDSEVQSEEYVSVSEDMVRPNKRSFVLAVKGDSMIDAGIFDGDYVVACSDLEPRWGDIVVALVDNQNTVKRYMRGNNGVYLKAENAEYEDIYPENELYIQGVVTGLMRNYR